MTEQIPLSPVDVAWSSVETARLVPHEEGPAIAQAGFKEAYASVGQQGPMPQDDGSSFDEIIERYRKYLDGPGTNHFTARSRTGLLGIVAAVQDRRASVQPEGGNNL